MHHCWFGLAELIFMDISNVLTLQWPVFKKNLFHLVVPVIVEVYTVSKNDIHSPFYFRLHTTWVQNMYDSVVQILDAFLLCR